MGSVSRISIRRCICSETQDSGRNSIILVKQCSPSDDTFIEEDMSGSSMSTRRMFQSGKHLTNRYIYLFARARSELEHHRSTAVLATHSTYPRNRAHIPVQAHTHCGESSVGAGNGNPFRKVGQKRRSIDSSFAEEPLRMRFSSMSLNGNLMMRLTFQWFETYYTLQI